MFKHVQTISKTSLEIVSQQPFRLPSLSFKFALRVRDLALVAVAALLCFAAAWLLLLAFPGSEVAAEATAAPSCGALLCSCLAVRRLQVGNRNFTCGFLSVNFIASCWPRFCNQAKFPDNCTKRCCCCYCSFCFWFCCNLLRVRR